MLSFDDLINIYEESEIIEDVKKNNNICEKCKIDLVEIYEESIKVCPNCAECTSILITVPNRSDIERCRIKKKYNYKRSTHINDKLKFFMCRKKTTVPEWLMKKIEDRLHNLNILKNEVSHNTLRYILNRFKLPKFYRHIHTIHNKLTGKKSYYISSKELELVNRLFNQIDSVYKYYIPKNRKSFLSYNVVLHKLFNLINRPDIAEHFPLLKGFKTSRMHYHLWKNISKHLDIDRDNEKYIEKYNLDYVI